MKDWYRQLKLEYKIVAWSLIVLAGIIFVLIPLFFFSLMEVPQGIALGAGVGIIIYLFLGLFNNSDSPKKSLVLTVITIIIRFLVIAGILVLVGWLYYAKGVKAFNIFAVVGGYMIPLIVHIIVGRKENGSGDSAKL